MQTVGYTIPLSCIFYMEKKKDLCLLICLIYRHLQTFYLRAHIAFMRNFLSSCCTWQIGRECVVVLRAVFALTRGGHRDGGTN